MSNRFPVSDEQIVKPKTLNTMKKALAKIEHLNRLLKDYNGEVRITEIVPLDELSRFCKQENINMHHPSSGSPHYWTMFVTEKVQAIIQTENLKETLTWE